MPPNKKAKKSIVVVTPKETWAHDFCLLSDKDATKTQSLTMLTALREAGLGKRKITFDNKRSGHGKFGQVLETIYPKLKSQNGAFELFRAERGETCCNLALIGMSAHGYTIPYLKEHVSSSTIMYVRPMQSNLPMTKVITRTDDSIKTTCQICTREVPLASLRSHMSECSSDSQDSFGASASSSPIFSESTRGEEAEDDNVALLDNLPLPSHQEKEMWHKELTDLFPLHSQQAIERSLSGAASMEETANNLIEVSTAGEEPKTVPKVKTNASLVSLLQDFRDSHSKEGLQEITIDRDAVWADTLRF